jgi:predicted DNA-binding protein (MmcQ/YjbR family)
MIVNLESLRSYCLKKEGKIIEEFPFDDAVLVFKAVGKIFILIRTDTHPLTINLKCEPEHALELRERYEAVSPGYHMNKKHWNTVTLDGTIPSQEIVTMIDHSYDLIIKGSRPTIQKNPRKKTSQ